MLLSHRPAPPLSSYVETLWYCRAYEAPHVRERVLPNGRFQLIIDLVDKPPLIVGMQSHYAVIDTAAIQSVMGVLFRPGGARALFDVPLDEFYNRYIPLELVWGAAVAELLDRLREADGAAGKFRILEAALQKRAERPLGLHAAVQHALEEFRREPHIRGVLEVTRQTGLSRRRLSHLFREQVGLTPKLFCRLHRFQGVVRCVASGAPVDWADVALAGGYCDQAHMAHEFREFSGISPGSYLAGKRPFPNHVCMD